MLSGSVIECVAIVMLKPNTMRWLIAGRHHIEFAVFSRHAINYVPTHYKFVRTVLENQRSLR